MSWVVVAAWLDCLVCVAVEMAFEVGGAVVLSDIPRLPSVVVVSDENAVCPVVD